jgi:hypothetical protein
MLGDASRMRSPTVLLPEARRWLGRAVVSSVIYGDAVPGEVTRYRVDHDPRDQHGQASVLVSGLANRQDTAPPPTTP